MTFGLCQVFNIVYTYQTSESFGNGWSIKSVYLYFSLILSEYNLQFGKPIATWSVFSEGSKYNIKFLFHFGISFYGSYNK